MSYKFFAWLNVVLLAIQLIPYLMVLLNKHILKTKSESYRNVIKGFRKYHKQTGIALLATGLIHGYLALGAFRLHTGTILYLAILLSAILGGAFYRKKEKRFLKVHRAMALIITALFLLHRLAPNAMFYLLKSLNLQ